VTLKTITRTLRKERRIRTEISRPIDGRLIPAADILSARQDVVLMPEPDQTNA